MLRQYLKVTIRSLHLQGKAINYSHSKLGCKKKRKKSAKIENSEKQSKAKVTSGHKMRFKDQEDLLASDANVVSKNEHINKCTLSE